VLLLPFGIGQGADKAVADAGSAGFTVPFAPPAAALDLTLGKHTTPTNRPERAGRPDVVCSQSWHSELAGPTPGVEVGQERGPPAVSKGTPFLDKIDALPQPVQN
jgi:hypothetical protein